MRACEGIERSTDAPQDAKPARPCGANTSDRTEWCRAARVRHVREGRRGAGPRGARHLGRMLVDDLGERYGASGERFECLVVAGTMGRGHPRTPP